MDNSQPMVFDKRPKRRKAKDNPYELFTAGAETDHPHYYLAFTDGSGVRQFIEINELMFKAFDHFELDDLSQMNSPWCAGSNTARRSKWLVGICRSSCEI